MNTRQPHDLDLIRAWLEGALDPVAERALLDRMSQDAAFEQEVARYRAAYHFTAPLDTPGPAPSADFTRLWSAARRGAPSRTGVWAAAAAALLVLSVGAVLLTQRGPATPRPLEVTLQAISLSPPVEVPSAEELPPGLSSFAPVQGGAVQWLDDLAAARTLAHATGRPLLVHEYVEQCPMCRRMDATVFRDAGVLAVVAETIPVRLDLQHTPQELVRRVRERAWPYYALEPAEPDASSSRLAGMRTPRAFLDALREALETVPRDLPTWDTIRASSAALAAARADEEAGALGHAALRYSAQVQKAPLEAQRRVAEAGRARVLARATDAMQAAQAAARAGRLDTARELLDASVRRFQGSALGRDFQRVREGLDARGAFPTLKLED